MVAGVVAVGQHEHVELPGVAGGGHRFAGGAQAGEHGGHVFVADRHDDRGARVGRGGHRVVHDFLDRQRVFVALERDVEAHQRGDEAGDDPGRQQREQAHLAVFEPGVFIVGLHAGEQRRGHGRAQHGDQQKDLAAAAGGELPGFWRIGAFGGLDGLAAGSLHQHAGEKAVPETAPWQRRHAAAVDRRRGHGVGMAFFAHGAAQVHDLALRLPAWHAGWQASGGRCGRNAVVA
jgi:hypothetical protein